jgi:lysophospholipase L1-like esterase
VKQPLVLSMYGNLIAGPRNGDLAQLLPEDHYWKQLAAEKNATVDQFDAVVVALGTNDTVDITNGLDPDFIIEQRARPLLQWLGTKPVYWILPHYARWPTAMQNIRFSSTRDGLDCHCNGTSGHTGTQCNILDEMQACAVDDDLQRQTINTFRAIHALRERLVALQDEYANLIIVDAAQTVASVSNGSNDLYTTMSVTTDTTHFSTQGSEWYAWLHAWLAMHADPGCTMPALPKWQMNSSEIAMAAQLESAPQ